MACSRDTISEYNDNVAPGICASDCRWRSSIPLVSECFPVVHSTQCQCFIVWITFTYMSCIRQSYTSNWLLAHCFVDKDPSKRQTFDLMMTAYVVWVPTNEPVQTAITQYTLYGGSLCNDNYDLLITGFCKSPWLLAKLCPIRNMTFETRQFSRNVYSSCTLVVKLDFFDAACLTCSDIPKPN